MTPITPLATPAVFLEKRVSEWQDQRALPEGLRGFLRADRACAPATSRARPAPSRTSGAPTSAVPHGNIARSAASTAGPAVEPIVGHNVSFDLRFLDYNTRHIAGCGFACADYDTMQISRALFPAQRHHRLADLIVRFGIADNEEHRALSDAIQTQQCFEWMRHYVTEHHESEAIRWKQAPAKNSAEILHQQLVVKR